MACALGGAVNTNSTGCERCGAAPEYVLLTGYDARGSAVFRRWCHGCADQVDTTRVAAPDAQARTALVLAGISLVVGLLLGGLSLVADHVGASGHPGFGIYQRTGVILGLIALAVGALARVALLEIAGLVVFAVAAFADLLMLKFRPGFGWKQQLVALLAAGLLALALTMRRRVGQTVPSEVKP